MVVTKSTKETEALAKSLVPKIKGGKIVCLYGDLGSGKTTFSKALGEGLGIEKFSIKSPTYTYMREYPGNIYHIDLYRIQDADEPLAQEIAELFENPRNIIIIEWPERLEQYLPVERINICLEYIDENSRKISINEL